jgi:ribosome-associated protein
VAAADREVRFGPGRAIPAAELDIRFSRSGGPGGQNVNKVETRAEVRVDVAGTPRLSADERGRVLAKLASRLTKDGVLCVLCDRTRHRERNLREALQKAGEVLREALVRPRVRRATRPTKGSKVRRLEEKRRRSEVKSGRRHPGAD